MKAVKNAISYKAIISLCAVCLSLIITFGVTQLVEEGQNTPTRSEIKARELTHDNGLPSTVVQIDNVSRISLSGSTANIASLNDTATTPISILAQLEKTPITSTQQAQSGSETEAETTVLPSGFTASAILTRTEKGVESEIDSGARHYVYSQSLIHSGNRYPVLGAVARVDMAGSGAWKGFGATIVSDTEVRSGAFSRQKAQDLAMKEAVKLFGSGDLKLCQTNGDKLMVVNKTLLGTERDETNYLTHVVDICNSSDPIGFHHQYYISLANGAIVYDESKIIDSLDRRVFDCTNLNQTGRCDTKRFEGDAVVGGEFDTAYDSFGDLYNLWKNKFQRDGMDNKGISFKTNVKYDPIDPQKGRWFCPNASWSPISLQTMFCPGLAVKDVVAHEGSHGLTHFTAGLEYQNQSGALNESISDIFAHAVDSEDWDLGEDSAIGVLRKMNDPKNGAHAQPDRLFSPNFYCLTRSNQQNAYVHINSGILNYAYYLMVDGGNFNGCTITSIGEDKAIAVIYKALTVYMRPTDNFRAAYEAINSACSDLYGAGSAECATVNNAMEAVEMDQQDPGTQLAPQCNNPSGATNPNKKQPLKPKCSGVAGPTSTPASGQTTPTPTTVNPTRGGLTPTPVTGGYCTPPQPGLLDNAKENIIRNNWFVTHGYGDCKAHNSGLWPEFEPDCSIVDRADGPSAADKKTFADPINLYYKHLTPKDGLNLFPRSVIIDILSKIKTPAGVDEARRIITQAVNDLIKADPSKAASVSFDSLYLGIEGGNEGNPVRSASLMVHPVIERLISDEVGSRDRVNGLYKPFIEAFIGKRVLSSDVIQLYEAALNKCGAGAIDGDQSGLGLTKDFGDYIAIVQFWSDQSGKDIFSEYRDCNIHIVKKLSCRDILLTGTPTPTTVGGPTSTPTPTDDPSEEGNIVLDLSIRFQGITSKPTGGRDRASVRVGMFSNNMNAPEYKQVEFVSDEDGIWNGRASFDLPNDEYVVYIKGPSHLQKKVGHVSPSESVGGTYNPGLSKIALESGINELDFSAISQPACDVPGPENPPAGVAKKQDGLCNSYDITKVRSSFGAVNDPICDLNRDGYCNAQDRSLQLETLEIQFDQD